MLPENVRLCCFLFVCDRLEFFLLFFRQPYLNDLFSRHNSKNVVMSLCLIIAFASP